MLHQLDAADKHRIIQPVLLAPTRVDLQGQITMHGQPVRAPYDLVVNEEPLEDGSTFSSVVFHEPVLHAKFDTRYTMTPSLDMRTVPRVTTDSFLPMMRTLDYLARAVGTIVGAAETIVFGEAGERRPIDGTTLHRDETR